MNKVFKIAAIVVLSLLFINFILGHVIMFVINNFLPALFIGIVAFILLRRHDRKRSGAGKR